MAIPVKTVRGIGPKTVAYLATKKIKTAEQLLKNNIDLLAAAPGIGPVRAEAAMKDAANLVAATASTGKPEKTGNKPTAGKRKDKKQKDRKKNKDKKKDKKNKKGKKEKKKDKKKNK